MSKSIFVSFPDEPSVHVVEEVIHSGPGEDILVKCSFSASPSVDVTWKHNGSDIDFGLRSNLVSETQTEPGMEHWIIKLSDLKDTDFGEYSCKGSNYLGEAEGTVSLSGGVLIVV